MITITIIEAEELFKKAPEGENDKEFLRSLGVSHKGILDIAWQSIPPGYSITQEEFHQTFLQEFSETICQLDPEDTKRLYEIFRGSCTVVKLHRRKHSSEETKENKSNVTIVELTKTSEDGL